MPPRHALLSQRRVRLALRTSATQPHLRLVPWLTAASVALLVSACSGDLAFDASEPTTGGGQLPGGPDGFVNDVGSPSLADIATADAAGAGPVDKVLKGDGTVWVPPLEVPRGGLTLSATHAA